jgi:hypothetical protein
MDEAEARGNSQSPKQARRRSHVEGIDEADQGMLDNGLERSDVTPDTHLNGRVTAPRDMGPS